MAPNLSEPQNGLSQSTCMNILMPSSLQPHSCAPLPKRQSSCCRHPGFHLATRLHPMFLSRRSAMSAPSHRNALRRCIRQKVTCLRHWARIKSASTISSARFPSDLIRTSSLPSTDQVKKTRRTSINKSPSLKVQSKMVL